MPGIDARDIDRLSTGSPYAALAVGIDGRCIVRESVTVEIDAGCIDFESSSDCVDARCIDRLAARFTVDAALIDRGSECLRIHARDIDRLGTGSPYAALAISIDVDDIDFSE